MSLNRYQLRHKARQGHRGARLADLLLQRPDRLIGLILLGNNLVNFSAASLVAIIALEMGGEPAVAIGTLLLTLVVLIFSEAAPKTLAALHPERLAFPAALIYYPLLKITYPIVWLTNAASNGVLFLFGVRRGDTGLQPLTREELRTVVHEAGGRIAGRYQQMLLSILDLERVTVDDVMVPHNEIIGIDLDDEIAEIEEIIFKSEHTRLPVYEDDVDNVVGILHLRRLANLAPQSFDKTSIRKLLDEPYFVPEGTPLSKQLVQFQRRRERVALVVDEYGDIQGIVTLEDILEEIVGEFTTDPADQIEDVVPEGPDSFLVSGTANIRELNRAQGWELPTDGPKTLNGLILELLETIPDPSTCLKISGYPLEIVASDENRVRTVRIGPRIAEPEG
ncbi:MAG: HlyC/CorC family transporter [Gammaproteobacteria bacterium]|nr:HlyC/CorC family transporter [Gammaproteobacteria bacterium]MDH3848984.1 HlyC/CorC family transporter [Gammaproteobacteria bacterium]MDH3905610.1 HlyC/CorC family transporter [Gammaproteobacteria bacterium]MDH3954333.1 HlyC/CorC family transporter [Gammaproteobacteria bacterium]MDH4004638.1 HlyC/CorC family transporter [Gammaproteobacteria bacterium]